MKYKHDDIFAGRYKLVEHIGVGGFAEVWKAEDIMAENSTVAIKIFAPDKGLDADGITVFRREYALTLPLRHNHLLTAYHFDVHNGSPYLIMPYCSAGSLMSRIVGQHSFSEQEIADLTVQITDGLNYLHENAITHQDLKPDNVLILKPGYYVLADFGISSRIRRSVARSMRPDKAKSYSAFTPAYAPPEKYISKPTPAGDIFSLGVTLYECLTGDVPFEDIGAALERGATIPDLPEPYSTELNNLIQKCLSVNPENRPSAKELNTAATTFLIKGRWPDLKGGDKKPGPGKKTAKGTVLVHEVHEVEPSSKKPPPVPSEKEPPADASDKKPPPVPVDKKPVHEKPKPHKPATSKEKKTWLTPVLIIAFLLGGAFSVYKFWPNKTSEAEAQLMAEKKEFTETFFFAVVDSISHMTSVEELNRLKASVEYTKDTAGLYDSVYFEQAGFDASWNKRMKYFITRDSIQKAEEEFAELEKKRQAAAEKANQDLKKSNPQKYAALLICDCIEKLKDKSELDKLFAMGRDRKKLEAFFGTGEGDRAGKVVDQAIECGSVFEDDEELESYFGKLMETIPEPETPADHLDLVKTIFKPHCPKYFAVLDFLYWYNPDG